MGVCTRLILVAYQVVYMIKTSCWGSSSDEPQKKLEVLPPSHVARVNYHVLMMRCGGSLLRDHP